MYIADVWPYFPFFPLYLKCHILLISVHYILHHYSQLAHAFVRVVFFMCSLNQIQFEAICFMSLETHERFLKVRLVPF